MRIHTATYANCDELEEDSGIRLMDCSIFDYKDPGMVWVDCSDDEIKELRDDIVYLYHEVPNHPDIKKMENTLALLKYIRKCMRATDGIYVYWCW